MTVSLRLAPLLLATLATAPAIALAQSAPPVAVALAGSGYDNSFKQLGAVYPFNLRGIDSRDAKRDEHLRSADFFDVEHHPTVTFRSTRVEAPQGPSGDLRVTGDLTIRGITRPVTRQVEPLENAIQDPWGNARRGVSARGRVNRKDWALKWNLAIEAGGVAVGDEVTIEIDAELVAQAS